MSEDKLRKFALRWWPALVAAALGFDVWRRISE